MPPRTSLVLPCYNRDRYLAEAIASVLQQTDPDFELLVWDDGSTDGSLEIAQRFAAADRRVRVMAGSHGGAAAARKAAIAHTTGRYIGCLDSDDRLAPTALAETVALLEAQPDTGMVYTRYRVMDEAGAVLGLGRRGLVPYSPERLLVDFMTFHFRLMRRTMYDQVGGIDPTMHFTDDYDLCLRLSEVTEIRQIPQPLYDYRIHPGGLSQAHRLAQIAEAERAIAQALTRRGLGDRLRVRVDLAQQQGEWLGQFSLVPVPPSILNSAQSQQKPDAPRLRWAAVLAALALLGLSASEVAIAQSASQSVQPARNTRVNRQGNRLDISGGRRSRDGRNLFHTFRQFGLSQGEIANFLSTREVRNILARVNGGSTSLIDGIVRVSGSSANLYLMNPAGVIFGRNARLDLAGSFTATSASGIGFADGWFSAVGEADYDTLIGNPQNFAFAMAQPGAIVNAGDLAVAPGNSLTLLGGAVANTGTLSAPEGTVTLASVPGQNRVRISQAGSLLSLEIQPSAFRNGPNPLPFTPASLPALLTGGDATNATGLTVNPDGTVSLTGSGLALPSDSGTTIASGRIAASSPSGTGGAVNVLGDRLALVNADINTSGATGGGQIQVGGGYQGRGSVPNARRTYVSADSSLNADAIATGSGGQVVIWSDEATAFSGTVSSRGGSQSGNGGLVEISGKLSLGFDGTVDASAPNGQAGTLLLDPFDITISNLLNSPGVDDALPGIFASELPNQSINISENSLQNFGGDIILEATNNITIVDGLDLFLDDTGGTGTIRFVADADNDGAGGFSMGANNNISTGGRNLLISGAFIRAGNLDTGGFSFSASGQISLQARGDITTARLNTQNQLGYGAGSLDVISQFGNISIESIDTRSVAGDEIPFAEGSGGNVTLRGDRVQVTGIIADPDLTEPTSIFTQGSDPLNNGTITITHAGGPSNLNFVVGTAGTPNGTRGSISTGTTSIIEGQFEVGPSGNTDSTVSGITLNSINSAPTLNLINPNQGSGQQGQTIRISVNSLGFSTTDPNGDTVGFEIGAIAPGVTITRNDSPVRVGTVINPGDNLDVTLPNTGTGPLDVFTVAATDPNGQGGVLSRSPARPVQVSVQPRPDDGGNGGGTVRPPERNSTDDEFSEEEEEDDDLGDDFEDIGVIGDPWFPTIEPDIYYFEDEFSSEFVEFLGLETTQPLSLADGRAIAFAIEEAAGVRPAFVYISFVPPQSGLLRESIPPQDTDQLELVVVTSQNTLIRKRIEGATRAQVMATAQEFRSEVTNPANVLNTRHLRSAQQLYQWFVAPIKAELDERQVENLVFLPQAGLRALPYAALHDGEQFLVEQYSVGLMPSLSLTDTRYVDIRTTQMLAMGVSKSTQGQVPLPSVPLELNALVLKLWRGQIFLDERSTLANLRAARQQQPFGIIHLATHADFVAGNISSSYIQFWNERLGLDQVKQLGWNDPPVEMLVLSACRTALGNEQAELGFAGLAVQTGVKSVVASLWYVSDAATTALMTRFYENLATAPIKAEALRQAQVAMARGEVSIDETGRLRGLGKVGELILPSSSSGELRGQTLSHPYYWAAFTMIGNPW
jgi:filamentous hemagglutinin family protein